MILPITVVWDFNPVFFSIGSFDIRYYGLMWVLAILGGMLFFDQVCKREGLPQKVMARWPRSSVPVWDTVFFMNRGIFLPIPGLSLRISATAAWPVTALPSAC